MIQAFPTDFPSPNTPIIDVTTGRFTNDGRYLLLALWNRTGGGTGIAAVASDPLGTNAGTLTATGASAADALLLQDDWNEFGTVAAGTGAIMPQLSPGQQIEIWNLGANNLLVYPFAGATIDSLGTGNPYVLLVGDLKIFQVWSMDQIKVL